MGKPRGGVLVKTCCSRLLQSIHLIVSPLKLKLSHGNSSVESSSYRETGIGRGVSTSQSSSHGRASCSVSCRMRASSACSSFCKCTLRFSIEYGIHPSPSHQSRILFIIEIIIDYIAYILNIIYYIRIRLRMTDVMIICSMLFLLYLYLSSNQKYILDIEHSNKLMNLSYMCGCACVPCVCVYVSVCLCLSVCVASACEVKV